MSNRTVFARVLSPALALVVAAGWAASAAPARAQSQVLDFTGGFLGVPGGSLVSTFGWRFTLSAPATVTDLGLFDRFNDGFGESHQIGLWDSSGTLRASTTLASGLSGTSVVASGSGQGAFRYNGISSVALEPGTYDIGASYTGNGPDFYFFSANAPTMLAGFSYTGGRFTSATGFVRPTNASGDNSFFGPNLRVTVGAAAPEPGSAALALLGAGVIGVTARRRAR